jgi:hypothetical protein
MSTPQSNSNSIFSFVNVRPAQKISKNSIASENWNPLAFLSYRFFDSIDPGVLEDIETTEPLLYTQLLEDLEDASEDKRAVMQATVSNYRNTSGFYYPNFETLNAAYPELMNLLDLLVDNNFDYTASTFKTAIESEILPSTISAFLADTGYLENKLRLWDNLFAEVVFPLNISVRESLSFYIRILNLLEQIEDENEVLDTVEGFQKGAEAIIMMPDPVFPVPMPENEQDINTDPPDDGGYETAFTGFLDRISELKTAQAEIVSAIEAQDLEDSKAYKTTQTNFLHQFTTYNGKCGEPPSEPSISFTEYLRAPRYEALSETTKDFVTEIGLPVDMVSRQNVTEFFNGAIREAYDGIVSLGPRPSDSSVSLLLGSAVVSMSNYCMDVFTQANPCLPFYGSTIPAGSGGIGPIGIGDLLRLDQQVLKYEMGEIAHIENIMASEERNREHRKFKRVEESFTSETERYNETESHSQTTDRYSMERETSQVINNMSQNQSGQDSGFGVGVTAGYGPVSVNASYNSSTNSSSSSVNAATNAVNSATRFAKEVTQKAMKRIIERVREQRSRTTIDEMEEINKGAFLNGSGTNHIIGMYHWIDKFYHVKLQKYGVRTFFEFMIPEPAAFHIYSKLNAPVEGGKYTKPVHPTQFLGINSCRDIDRVNYTILAAKYGITDMPSPPQEFVFINKAIGKDKVASNDPYPAPFTLALDDLEIPEGYITYWFDVVIGNSWGSWVHIFVGDQWRSNGNTWSGPLPLLLGKIPVALNWDPAASFVCNVFIKARLISEAFEKWQMKAYNALMDTYNRQMADYEDQVAGAAVSAGVSIQGENPEINRMVEKEELRRASLELLTGQKFEAFDAMQDNQPSQKYPQFINTEAKVDGNYVKFCETGFEWHNMIYHFYPYFWSRKKKWVVLKNHQDPDPMFTKFLQAGYARVLVPVRPEMLGDILYYCKTGQLWSGGNPPAFTDPNYVSILTETQNNQGVTDDTPVTLKEWDYKMPTSLVMLQGAIPPVLPTFTP